MPQTKKSTAAAPVTKVQHRVLACIVKAGGPQRRAAILKLAFNGASKNLKVVLEPMCEAGLLKAKEVKVVDGDGTETLFAVTPAGRKVASKPLPVAQVSRNGSAGPVEHLPLPKVGGTFTKDYKGKTVTVKVVDGGFQIGKTTYTSLTAAAKAVRGTEMEVNGWSFFGLTKAAK